MKKIFLLAAAAIALAACSNEDIDMEESVAAQVTATIGASAATRASGTAWDAGDCIGVTMAGRYVNLKYTTGNADGNFTGTTMYFTNKREPVTMTAYYPFAGEEGSAPGVVEAVTGTDVQTPQGQRGIDFLYAEKKDVRGDLDPKVNFNFSHRMGKLTLRFNNGVGMGGVRVTRYEIGGLVLDGTFDTATGVCTAKPEAVAKPLAINVTGETDGRELPSLILFPQATANKEVTLNITDSDGQYYECRLTFEDNRIAAGNNYLFTVTVNKTGLTVGGSQITDWTRKEGTPADASSVNPK